MYRVTTALLVALVLVAGGPAFGAAVNPASQHLANLVGTWHCTFNQGGKIHTYTSTGLRLNDNWVQLTQGGFRTFVSYDARHKQWVQLGFGPEGLYGVATADGKPRATSLTWRGQYPSEMRGHVTTITWASSSKRVFNSMDLENGKWTHSTGICSKA